LVVEPERKASGNSSAWRIFYAAVLCLALALAVVPVAGCGLQTDQANKDLTKANAHQQEAEALIARVKALPDDWQRIFATPSPTPQQIAQVRDVITARVADLDALGKVTKNWSSDIKAISKLNVDDKIKEYARLKLASINAWEDYASLFLTPLVKGYGNLLDAMAAGRPASEQQAAASQLTGQVSDSIQRLQECLQTQKTADDYFKDNKLGK
jgi:hypothetical protein